MTSNKQTPNYNIQRCGLKSDCEKLNSDFKHVSSALIKAQEEIEYLKNHYTEADLLKAKGDALLLKTRLFSENEEIAKYKHLAEMLREALNYDSTHRYLADNAIAAYDAAMKGEK